MGALTTRHVVVGGRLVANPTDFDSPETNCDGTLLGTVQNIAIKVTRKIDPITAAEWGSAMVDGILLDEEVELSGTFTTWDEDAVANWAYGGVVGSGSVPTLTIPGAYGSLVETALSPSLLWLPNDPTVHPAFYLYNAVPWELPKKMFFSGRKPLVVEARFIGVRDASNNVFKSCLLADL